MNTRPETWPRLFLIADGFAGGRIGMEAEAVRARVAALVEAGLTGVQLRDHGVAPEVFAAAAAPFAGALRRIRPEVVLVVNTHLETAAALGARGHVGRRGPTPAEARRRLGRGVLGASVHTPEEAADARRAGVDYVVLSPIFPTKSHPEADGLGFEALHDAAEACGPVPVYALGGITPARVPACRAAGAYGVAVLSDLLDAPDPAWRYRDYQTALA